MLYMATTSLQNALDHLDQLPAPVQDTVARQIMAYVGQWQALQGGIAEACDDIEHGRVTEITNIEGYVDTLSKEHEES